MATKTLDTDDGFFHRDNAGREVIQWTVSHQFPVRVGDVVECEGRTVTIEAIGKDFQPRGSKRKFAYLYLTVPVPVARQAQGYTPEFTGDGSLDALEAERNSNGMADD